MVERRDRAGFALEALQSFRAARKFGMQQLECHRPLQNSIARQPDFAHPAGAELRLNLIVVDHLAHGCPQLRLGHQAGGHVDRRTLEEGFVVMGQQLLDFGAQRGIFTALGSA